MVSIESHVESSSKEYGSSQEINSNLSEVKDIGDKIATKLRSNGFSTIEMVASSTPEQMARIPGIGLSSAQKIINNARQFLENSFLPTAMPVEKEMGIKISSTTFKDSSEQVECARETSDVQLEMEQVSLSNVDKFEEEMDYTPLRTPIFPPKTDEIEIDQFKNRISEPLNTPSIIQPEDIQIHNKSIPSMIKKPRVPFREARIMPHPRVSHLLQRQKSAQKILKIIREVGLIEIPMNRPELREVFHAVDLLACKPMRGENGRCVILLIPIKHVTTEEPVYVWDSHVMTGVLNENPTTAKNMAINTFTKKLLRASDFLFSDIISGKSLISLVARYIGISMKTNLTFKNRRLYLGSGEIEYQVIIDPVLVCDTEVYCLEKSLPYAYQNESNLHVVPLNQLDELLDYLEQKYRIMTRYDTTHNALMKVEEVKTFTFKQAKLFSLPFIAYGILFGFFLLLGFQDVVRFCISLSIGLIFIYAGVFGYLVYHHFQSLRIVGSEFFIPYHQKHVELSDEDFILINEQLSPEWMAQFTHEIENVPEKSSQKKAKKLTILKQKELEKEDQEEFRNLGNENDAKEILFHTPINNQSKLDEFKNKYQKFLDD